MSAIDDSRCSEQTQIVSSELVNVTTALSPTATTNHDRWQPCGHLVIEFWRDVEYPRFGINPKVVRLTRDSDADVGGQTNVEDDDGNR